jgi:hypothetical protein
MALTRQLVVIRDSLDGVCQLCGARVKHLVCDHNHKNGMVRGFVCHKCNCQRIPANETNPDPALPLVFNYLKNPPLTYLNIMYRSKTKKLTMEPLNLRFEPDVFTRLRRQAELKGLTLAGLVRAVMEKWLNGEFNKEVK